MTLAAWVALITAALESPKEIMAIVALFKKTPEEKRQAIVDGATKVAEAFAETGRPTWDKP